MGTNVEVNPRHPVTGQFTKNPSTGKGHVEQSSADHAASIPGVGNARRKAGTKPVSTVELMSKRGN